MLHHIRDLLAACTDLIQAHTVLKLIEADSATLADWHRGYQEALQDMSAETIEIHLDEGDST